MRSLGNTGLSILEVIMVVAILGVLLAIGVPRMGTPGSRMFANDVKAQLEQARYEAIKRNAPVAVVLDRSTGVFRTRLDPNDPRVGAACVGSLVLQERGAEEYRNVRIDEALSNWNGAVVWLPSGQGRICSGLPSIGGDIVITDGRTTRTVELTVGGRVAIR